MTDEPKKVDQDKVPKGHKFVASARRGGKHKDQRPEKQDRATKKTNLKKEQKDD